MIVVYKWSFLLYFEKSLEGDGTKISSKGPSVFDLHLYCWSIISNMHRSTILWTYKGFNFCWNWQCVFWFIVWFTALQIPFKTGGDDAGRHECTWFGAVFWCCGAREFCWSRESACIKVSLSRFVYAATSPSCLYLLAFLFLRYLFKGDNNSRKCKLEQSGFGATRTQGEQTYIEFIRLY